MDIDIPYLIGIIIENPNASKEENKKKCFATFNFGDYENLNWPTYCGIKKAVLNYIKNNSLQMPKDMFHLTDSENEKLDAPREKGYNGVPPRKETNGYSDGKLFYFTMDEFTDDMSLFTKLLKKPDLVPEDTVSGKLGSVLDIDIEKNPDVINTGLYGIVNVVWEKDGIRTNPIPMIVVMRKKFINGVPEGEQPEKTEFDETFSDETSTDDEWGGQLGTDAELGEEENAEEDTEIETDQEEDTEDAEDTENNEENENDVEDGSEDEEQTVDDEWKSEETEIDGKRYDVFGNEI